MATRSVRRCPSLDMRTGSAVRQSDVLDIRLTRRRCRRVPRSSSSPNPQRIYPSQTSGTRPVQPASRLAPQAPSVPSASATSSHGDRAIVPPCSSYHTPVYMRTVPVLLDFCAAGRTHPRNCGSHDCTAIARRGDDANVQPVSDRDQTVRVTKPYVPASTVTHARRQLAQRPTCPTGVLPVQHRAPHVPAQHGSSSEPQATTTSISPRRLSRPPGCARGAESPNYSDKRVSAQQHRRGNADSHLPGWLLRNEGCSRSRVMGRDL
ncbi:uncharacterized protein B0H18DRAFT_136744 [Fomitopsis serialis]|uniref:uncharacterized protein n=1 Tax=Fomitopsis serialis TaxID=139415 RepID=UPI002007920F|nr:uncharacterized protein B0H18DRAFT_136744 [Neoantrodia serialis]KAH9914339.1 hypothetical protein B0H18DRAFT_136744 [Neoantrodia serialis]